MDDPFMIVLIPVAILIVVGVEYAKYKRDARRIHLCLHGKAATDISIVKVWSEGDRWHNVYDESRTRFSWLRGEYEVITTWLRKA